MCEHSQLLSRYLDGECSVRERRFIEEHLLICDECAKEKISYYRFQAALQGVNSIKAPDGFTELTMKRISQSHRAFGPLDFWIERRTRAEKALLALGLAITFLLVTQFTSGLLANIGSSNHYMELQSAVKQLAYTVSALPQKVLNII